MNFLKNYKLTPFITVLLLLLLTTSHFLLTDVHAAKKDVAAMVTQVMGKMEVQREGKTTWERAKSGMFLYQGDKLRTAKKSKAAIMFSNGAEVKINQNTEFAIDISEPGKSDTVRINKGQGTCSLRAKKGGGLRFSVKTPVAVVSVRGTEFDTDVSENGDTTVMVVKGIVQFENEYGSVEVKENQQATATGGNAPGQPEEVKKDEMDGKRGWQEEIKIERKTLNMKIKTDAGEEKTIKLKFKK